MINRRRGASAAFVAGVLCAATAPSPASAHGVQYPKRQELTIEPNAVRLETKLDVHGHDEGTQLRERFDADHDGKLDQDEAQQLGRQIVAEEHRTLVLLVNGKPVSMTMTALSDDGLVGPVRVTEHQKLAAVWEAPLSAPPQTVRLVDHVDEGMRRVPVVVRVRGARVASAGSWEVTCDAGSGTSRIDAASVTEEAPLELVLVPGATCVGVEAR